MDDQFPRGRFNAEDEGNLKIGIAVQDRTVIVNFFKPIGWFGMDRATALQFAEAIRIKAESIR